MAHDPGDEHKDDTSPTDPLFEKFMMLVLSFASDSSVSREKLKSFLKLALDKLT